MYDYRTKASGSVWTYTVIFYTSIASGNNKRFPGRFGSVNSSWQDRPTFVTGATGLVGGWLVRRLLNFGTDVVHYKPTS